MNKSTVNETLLLLIWVQALLATLGSLFYSEIIGYIPCDLCWIQRIFMYPLVIIYAVATLKKNISTALPGLLLSVIGFFVSLYHYFIQKLPSLQDIGSSCSNVPCNLEYVNYFGFITIPFLAGLAFIVIISLHILLLINARRN